MRVSIVGAGYVGLVTGACLAESGHEVVVADLDQSKVDIVNAGVSPIHEAGLAELLTRNVDERLRATSDVGEAVRGSELTLVAVGTPSTSDGIDLSAIVSAARSVGEALVGKGAHHAVVVKSTVIPGTTDGIVTSTLEAASGRRAGEDLGVGMNPEFLTEGRAVADFMNPDRLVLGANDERTHVALGTLYEFVDKHVPRLLTSTRTAEAIKYASNALLATMISFANEIGDLCSAVGIDVVDVMRGVCASEYLSPVGSKGERARAPIASFLEAGCGFGGSCLPKDLRALVAEGERRGLATPVLRAVLETNQARADEVLRLLESAAGNLEGRRVTVLGVAFKPDTDDARESPAVPIVERLLARGARVTLHDPVVRDLPESLARLGLSGVCSDLEAALADAQAIVLVTRWDEYRALPLILAGRDPSPVVVDGRRMLDRDSVTGYVGIGVG